MLNRFIYESIDRSLRDVLDSTEPFAGIQILCMGDFHQTTVINPLASRAETLAINFRNSKLWKGFTRHTLVENMRVRNAYKAGNTDASILDAWDRELIDISRGFLNDPEIKRIHPNAWPVRDEMVSKCETLKEFVNDVYPNFDIEYNNREFLSERCILTPLHANRTLINDMLFDRIPEQEQIFTADDQISDDIESIHQELVAQTEWPGIPKHNLRLKKFAIVMVMRNINPAIGLVNGTKMIIEDMNPYFLHCRILSKTAFYNRVVRVPRIRFSSDRNCWISFTRIQFPVTLCYSMTINKSQGQTIKDLAIYLPNPVFDHGQYYTGVGRCGDPTHIKIFIEKTTTQGLTLLPSGRYVWLTRNVVFPELIEDRRDLIDDEGSKQGESSSCITGIKRKRSEISANSQSSKKQKKRKFSIKIRKKLI